MPHLIDPTAQKIINIIDQHRQQIIDFGNDIFKHGELGYKEYRTAEKFTEWLKQLSIDVESELAITGVKGYIKGNSSDITLALIGELDALRIPQHPNFNPHTQGVHACGHNIQLAAVLGAGIALANSDIKSNLDGNVVLFAVPSEEFGEIDFKNQLIQEGKIRYGGGKSELIRIGAFDDIDLSIVHHTDPELKGISVGNGNNNGFVSKAVQYIGKASHAAATPHLGINAVNASAVGLNAVAYVRETFKDNDHVRIHSIYTQGGDLVNVVPDNVKLESLVRASHVEAIRDAATKYDRALKAGAYAMGAEIKIDSLPGYLPSIGQPANSALLQAAKHVCSEQSVSQIDPQRFRAGSTDVGDLQHIQPVLTFNTSGVTGEHHSSAFRIINEEQAYIVPAKIFALATYFLLKEGAKQAKKAVEDYQPVFTKSQYIDYMESFINSEHFDKNLNLI